MKEIIYQEIPNDLKFYEIEDDFASKIKCESEFGVHKKMYKELFNFKNSLNDIKNAYAGKWRLDIADDFYVSDFIFGGKYVFFISGKLLEILIQNKENIDYVKVADIYGTEYYLIKFHNYIVPTLAECNEIGTPKTSLLNNPLYSKYNTVIVRNPIDENRFKICWSAFIVNEMDKQKITGVMFLNPHFPSLLTIPKFKGFPYVDESKFVYKQKQKNSLLTTDFFNVE